MAFGTGKYAILSEKDKNFVDLILMGNTKYEAFEIIYPEKVTGRTEKQIKKSIRDILSKPKVKEYKEQMEAKAERAIDDAIQTKATKLAEGIMNKDELMVLYTRIARDETANMQWRLKAMDSLSKYLFGLDKKSIDVNADVNSDIIINILDDEEEDKE